METEPHRLDRRTFFKLAGATSATLAIGAALTSCNGQIPFLKKNTTGEESAVGETQIDFAAEADVLIIGSGIAGISAAIDPIEAGFSVILADKASLLGGDSYTASGIFTVVGTDIQKDAGIDLSIDDAWKTLSSDLESSGNAENLEYKKQIFSTQTDWVNRVVSDYKASFENPQDYISQGSPEEILLPKNGLGDMNSVMKPLLDALSQAGLTTQLEAEAIDFILDTDDVPVGMRFRMSGTDQPYDIKASKIILATGGFACNQEMIQDNLPGQTQIGCIAIYTDGEGHRAGRSLGGQLIDMDNVPPLIGDIPQAGAWGLFGPTLIVNAVGARFAREDDAYAAAGACVENSYGYWWTIFDKQLAEGSQSRNIAQLTNKHATRTIGPFDTTDDLAKAMGISASALKASFDAYNKAVSAKKDTDFGRTLFLSTLTGPYYAIKQLPLRFKTLGGLKTDTNAQMVDAAGGTIANVYACGACSAYNMNGLASAAAMGMIAGQAATAALNETNGSGSSTSDNTPDSGSADAEPSDSDNVPKPDENPAAGGAVNSGSTANSTGQSDSEGAG